MNIIDNLKDFFKKYFLFQDVDFRKFIKSYNAVNDDKIVFTEDLYNLTDSISQHHSNIIDSGDDKNAIMAYAVFCYYRMVKYELYSILAIFELDEDRYIFMHYMNKLISTFPNGNVKASRNCINFNNTKSTLKILKSKTILKKPIENDLVILKNDNITKDEFYNLAMTNPNVQIIRDVVKGVDSLKTEIFLMNMDFEIFNYKCDKFFIHKLHS